MFRRSLSSISCVTRRLFQSSMCVCACVRIAYCVIPSDARESPPVRRTASGGSTPGAYPDATPSVVTPRSDDHEAVSSVITTTFTPASTISPDTRGHDNTNSAAKKGADWPLGGLTKENLMLVGSGVGETDFDSDARFPEDSFLRCCGERTWSSRGWSNGSFAGDNHSCVSTGDPGQQARQNCGLISSTRLVTDELLVPTVLDYLADFALPAFFRVLIGRRRGVASLFLHRKLCRL